MNSLLYREPNLISQLMALMFALPSAIALLLLSALGVLSEPTLGALAYGFTGFAVLLMSVAEFLVGAGSSRFRIRLRTLSLLLLLSFPLLLVLALL